METVHAHWQDADLLALFVVAAADGALGSCPASLVLGVRVERVPRTEKPTHRQLREHLRLISGVISHCRLLCRSTCFIVALLAQPPASTGRDSVAHGAAQRGELTLDRGALSGESLIAHVTELAASHCWACAFCTPSGELPSKGLIVNNWWRRMGQGVAVRPPRKGIAVALAAATAAASAEEPHKYSTKVVQYTPHGFYCRNSSQSTN